MGHNRDPLRKKKTMAFYAVNERVLILVNESTIEGNLVDIDMHLRQFKLKTDDGDSFWIDPSNIVRKI